MTSTSKCRFCGSVVRSDQVACPNCGAANELYVVDSPRTIFQPKTIEELQEYCAERGMPLLRMRFFIGEDFREAKAYGIYRHGADVVVYKNKADGSRAIRYEGPDEEYAVKEIYNKLMEECHKRGIYPDGRKAVQPNRAVGSSSGRSGRSRPASQGTAGRKPSSAGKSGGPDLSGCLSGLIFSPWKLFIVLVLLALLANGFGSSDDGYYRLNNDNRTYYNYGSDWYYTYNDRDDDTWYETSRPPVDNYSDYRLGEDWDSDWGISDFRDSPAWESQYGSSGSSYDWDDDDDWDWDDDDDWSWDDDDDWGWDSWDSDWGSDWDSDW